MRRNVYLHGHLKTAFGPVFKFDVATAGEALRALDCAFPGKFVAALREGAYQIVRGDRRTGMKLDLDLVTKFNLGRADIHIVPVAAGSSAKGRANTKTILGVALVGAAIFFSAGSLAAPLGGGLLTGIGVTATYGHVAMLGVGLALSGVSQMLAASQAPKTPESIDQAASWSFSGPTNTVEQGGAVPIMYGFGIVGSTVISAGMDIENAGAYGG